MKRFISVTIILLICCSLLACSTFGTGLKNPVTFYYPRSITTYGQEDSIISSEFREASGHANDLEYLISLYLHGPMDDTMVATFPQGTKLISLNQKNGVLYLTLSDSFANQSSLDLSVACACLSKTCFELCAVEKVEIRTENIPLGNTQVIVMTKDNVQFYDNSAQNNSVSNPTQEDRE